MRAVELSIFNKSMFFQVEDSSAQQRQVEIEQLCVSVSFIHRFKGSLKGGGQ